MREMGDTGSILEMTHISVEFPGVKALDDVQFDANRGEVQYCWVRMARENPPS